MNFFQHQDVARKKTGRLALLLVIGIVAMIALVYFAVMAALFVSIPQEEYAARMAFSWFDPLALSAVAGFVLLIVVGGGLMKSIQLRRGGAAVAEALGGRLLTPDTVKNNKEKRFLNIVDEMAIASGVPVPQAFVMDNEEGINAFAAGHDTSDAAVAVTKGCLDQLNRDELQGVIAHEFSHILNGDMRLNIRVIGLLAGVMALAIIGFYVMRVAAFSGSSRSKNSGGAGMAFFFGGLTLVVVGYAGVFVGQIIQSAISREREFLADASAVQFTRNPLGIGGALRKIGGFTDGSNIISPSAREASHMFFGTPSTSGLSSLFATHPPLDERISRIEGLPLEAVQGADTKGISPGAAPVAGAAGFAGGGQSSISSSVSQTMDSIGTLDEAHMAYGAKILEDLPLPVREATGDPLGAAALVCALLLDENPQEREHQLELLSHSAPKSLIEETVRMSRYVLPMDHMLRLPVVDLATPALRRLSDRQNVQILQWIRLLVEADSKVTLFEFAVQKVLQLRLDPKSGTKKEQLQYRSMTKVMPAVYVLISALAHAGHADKGQAAQAFKTAIVSISGDSKNTGVILPPNQLGFKAFDNALSRLSASSQSIRRSVLEAAAQCVLYDGIISVEEAELLRVVAYSLHLPLPPFLPNS